ncbi:hypothetical protein [Conexibacter woesei]|uniref:hypothetical protein n=1 Tax=Conexibacter woesei TaxID=191495 RepID=UPI0003FC4EBE|nr:hypothetical protein [Conexibacter woesei]
MLRLATPLSVFAVAGASLALAACGSSSDNSSSGSSGTSTTANGQSGTRNADFQKFQQCLKDNGVTLPNRGNRPGGSNAAPPNTDGGSTTAPPNGQPPQGGGYGGGPGGFGGQSADPKTQKAMRACAKYRPQGNFRGGNGNGAPRQNIRAFTAYLTCLRDAGLDVRVSDGFNALRNLKQSDPKVQAALKSCQSKLPQRPQASGTAPGNTTTNGTT